MDPKRPGQVLRPGVPSVSTGFTAPSPFSRGATSAFGPVLRAASNYLNEVTRSARLQNQITMSNMGGGGSAGSGSNIVVNGSVSSRNTQSILSRNPNSAPLNENVNSINSDGTYQSFRNNVIVADQDLFDYNANLGTQNLNASLPQNQPPQNLDYSLDNDEDSVQILADNNKQNTDLDNLINEQVNQPEDYEQFNNIEELNDNDRYLIQRVINADSPDRQKLLNKIESDGELDTFEKAFNLYRQLNYPRPNMSNVDSTFKQNIENFLAPKQEPNVTPPRSKTDTSSSNFGPDRQSLSSSGSPMYPSGVVEINSNYKMQNPNPNAINNLMNTGFSSPVYEKANSSGSSSSSSNIGGNSKSSKLRKFQSPLGDQDRKKLEELKKSSIPQMDIILDENVDDKLSESIDDDLSTEEQMEPSVYSEGSIPISSVSSKTRQSADDQVIAEQRAREEKGPGLTVRGKGKKVIQPIQTNVYKDQEDMQALENAGLDAQLDYIRQLVGYGHLKEDEQRRLFEDSGNLKQAVNAPVNVLVPKSKKNKGLRFSG